MPTYFQMMGVLSCSVLDFLPCLLLVVYPFRNHLRLKSFLAGVLSLVIAPVLLYADVSRALLGTVFLGLPVPLLRSILLLIFAGSLIRSDIRKVLLNTCSVINLSLLISALADRFTADDTAAHFLLTALLQILLLIPYTLNLAFVLTPTLNESEAPAWKLLFIAPATGTVLGCILLLTGSSAVDLVMAIVLILAAIAAIFTITLTRTEMITVILKKEKTPKKKVSAAATAPAAAAVSCADAVQIYLDTLQMRMADAELGYKELLLQVMTMEDDLNSDNLEQLRDRLNTVRNQLAPAVAPSGNPRVDSVLTFYTRQAMLGNVKVVSNISLPEISSVSDEDMTALMGCLLETALSSCREQAVGTRRIATAAHLDEDLLQIGVKFTYADPTDPDSELLNICRSIAARYDGKLAVIDMKGVTQIVASVHI